MKISALSIGNSNLIKNSPYNRLNNNCSVQKKMQVAFCSGLTPKAIDYINSTDVKYIENIFARRGIKADFEGNKVAAACSYMTTKIFDSLNLPLPTEIRATSFRKLNPPLERTLGFCNSVPSKRIPNVKSEMRSVAFNTDYMPNINTWDRVVTGSEGFSSTTHYLETFIHEFMHSAHFDYIFNKFGYNGETLGASRYPKGKNGKDGLSVLQQLRSKDIKQLRPMTMIQVSGYAAQTNSLEIIAESFTKDIILSLDPITNLPRGNTFLISDKKSVNLEKVLSEAWEGLS